jgi:hypothetical protein
LLFPVGTASGDGWVVDISWVFLYDTTNVIFFSLNLWTHLALCCSARESCTQNCELVQPARMLLNLILLFRRKRMQLCLIAGLFDLIRPRVSKSLGTSYKLVRP